MRDGQDEGSDHLAAWVGHELGVGEAAVTDALTACPRPDALDVARRLGADVRDGRVKVKSVGGLLRHRLREDPRHDDPSPTPPWPPGEDTRERRRRWEGERWEKRARRQEAETRRRLREED